ncbi:MAG: F0F1 ATP synthase subunit B [Candidatus Brocadiaceae bacterium]|jgi:F-type H+-transporting ATPase subunit b
MKPEAKWGLMIIGVLYTITVAVMVTNFVMQAKPKYPEQVKETLRQALNVVREEAYREDPQHIRRNEFSEKEAGQLLDLFIKKGSIININYTLIMQCFNFGILLLVLYGFLWEPLLQFLDRRRRHVREQLEDAASSRREAEALVKRRQQELAELRVERGEILEKARAAADQEREEIIERARREADRTTKQTRERLREEFRRARTALREEVAELTTRVARRLLKREITSSDHETFIQDMIEEMTLESSDRGQEGRQ